MTTAISIRDSNITPATSQPTDALIDATATATGAAMDTAVQRELRIEAVAHLLTTVWPHSVEGSDPDTLHAVAAALIDSGAAIPAVPSVRDAGRVLVEALSVARAAHARAIADHTAADTAWHDFRDDVRRRAGEAVAADYICQSGTNAALREWDIAELRQEYRVEVTVTVYVTVDASNEDDAYDAAEQEIRDELRGDGLDIDSDDIGHVSAEATGECVYD